MNAISQIALFLTAVIGIIGSVSGDCSFRGQRVCENSIVQHFISGKVRYCKEGEFSIQDEDVVRGEQSAAFDCDWYGERFCHGDVVNDLYSWWFVTKCHDGKMKVVPRNWQAVVTDPRYPRP